MTLRLNPVAANAQQQVGNISPELSHHAFSSLSARNRGSTRSLIVDALPNSRKGYGIWGKHKPASNLLLKTLKGLQESHTSNTKSQCHTPQQREENAFLHWEFSNKWFPESHSACFPAHTWHLLVKQVTRRKGAIFRPLF